MKDPIDGHTEPHLFMILDFRDDFCEIPCSARAFNKFTPRMSLLVVDLFTFSITLLILAKISFGPLMSTIAFFF
jgi:hypothetical protein